MRVPANQRPLPRVPPSTSNNGGVRVTVETDQHTATSPPASLRPTRCYAATVEDVDDDDDDDDDGITSTLGSMGMYVAYNPVSWWTCAYHDRLCSRSMPSFEDASTTSAADTDYSEHQLWDLYDDDPTPVEPIRLIGERRRAFYVVTRGRYVGIFDSW